MAIVHRIFISISALVLVLGTFTTPTPAFADDGESTLVAMVTSVTSAVNIGLPRPAKEGETFVIYGSSDKEKDKVMTFGFFVQLYAPVKGMTEEQFFDLNPAFRKARNVLMKPNERYYAVDNT